MDFVGKTENLEADCNYLARKLNIEFPALTREKRSLRLPYASYYTPETRDLIARKYAADIEAFGYHFDESSAPPILKTADTILRSAKSVLGQLSQRKDRR